MIFLNLLRTISFSHLFGEKLRAILSLTGVALGIALYSAIRLANFNAFQSFADSAALLRQGSDLSIVSTSGRLDEDVVASLLQSGKIAAINPISSRVVALQSPDAFARTAQAFGMDLAAMSRFNDASHGKEHSNSKNEDIFPLFARPFAALVSQELFDQLKGSPLTLIINGEAIQFNVAGILHPAGLGALFGGRTVLLDIATFQEAFSDFGKIDEIEIKANTQDLAAVRRDIAARLPVNVVFSSASDQQAQAKKLTAAFRLNLNFLAGISLLVGLLLIYNSISYTTLRRRSEFGVIRTLGGTKITIVTLLAVEAFVLGFIASAAGLALGYALSFAAVKMIGATFTSMYLPLNISSVRWSPEIAAEALLIGPGMTLLAAILPILEALTVAPRQTFSYQNFEDKFRGFSGKLALLSVVTFAITLLFARQNMLRANILLGFVAPTFLVLTALLLIPKSTEIMIELLRKIPLLGYQLPLALDHVTATLKRNSVAIASVAVALGMFIGMTVMISSFRQTVTRWIEHITTADLYISTGGLSHSVQSASNIPDRIVQYVIQQPEVVNYDWVLKAHVLIDDRQAQIIGVRFPVLVASDRLLLKNTSSLSARQRLYADPNTILASEAFATKFHVDAGDSVRVPTAGGEVTLTISDIFYDYTSEQGILMIPDQYFAALVGPTEKESLSLYLKSPQAAENFSKKIQQTFPDVFLTIRNNQALRSEVLRIFDQTFRITHALRIIALVISGITIFNIILILIIERAREFAILRAIGASTGVLKNLVATEAIFLGFASSLFGAFLGLGLALLLVFVVNKFFFGWSVEFSPSPFLFISTTAATIGIAWLAAIIASTRFKNPKHGESLRYE